MRRKKTFFPSLRFIKREWMLLLFIVMIALPCPSFSEDGALLPGQVRFEQLSDDQIKLFIDRALDGKALDLKEPVQIFSSDEQLQDFWIGNNPSMSATVDRISVDFANPAEGGDKSRPLPFGFQFEKDDIVVRHGMPLFHEQRGGIRVSVFDPWKARRFLFRGAGQTSMVVLVPQFSRKEPDRGVLLCPREFPKEGPRADRSRLSPISMSPTNLHVSVDGELHGSLRSSIEMVSARAEIVTSPRVHPSQIWQDSIESKNASVSIFYKPRKAILPYLDPTDNFVEGIGLAVDLHANTGFRRRSTRNVLVYVVPAQIDKEFTVPVLLPELIGTAIEAELVQRGIPLKEQKVMNVSVAPGQCYLVLRDTGTIIHEYSKEPFHQPDSLR